MTNVSNNSNEQRVQQKQSRIIQKNTTISIKNSVQQESNNVPLQCPTAVSFSSVTPAQCPDDGVTPPIGHHNLTGYTVRTEQNKELNNKYR